MPRSMNLNDTAWDILRHRETRDTIRQYDTLWNPLRCNETWDRMGHQETMHVIKIGSSPFTSFDCCLKHSGQKYTESINDLTSLLLFPNYRLKIRLPTSELLPYYCATKSPSSSSLLAGKCRTIVYVSIPIPKVKISVDPSSFPSICNQSKIT